MVKKNLRRQVQSRELRRLSRFKEKRIISGLVQKTALLSKIEDYMNFIKNATAAIELPCRVIHEETKRLEQMIEKLR